MGARCLLYEIRIQETLSQDRSEWFEGMQIRVEPEGSTVLRGPITDQAALHGLLARLRDLNLTLLSVNPVESESQRVPPGLEE